MKLGEMIKDALCYPTNNITSLLTYIVLGFVIGVVVILTGLSGFVTGSFKFSAGVLLGIIGIIIIIALLLMMLGYSLDVIKLGINRSNDGPKINFTRQVSNGFKYIIIAIVYMIIPILITFIMDFIFGQWIALIIGLIVAVIFSFALSMAICRLAKTDELSHALNIGGSIEDILDIGLGKVIITLIGSEIVALIIVFLLTLIITMILGFILPGNAIKTVVPIIAAVLDSWLLFYSNRIMGLLYSHK